MQLLTSEEEVDNGNFEKLKRNLFLEAGKEETFG